MKSLVCIAIGIAALAVDALLLPMFQRPLGDQSHFGIEGAMLSVAMTVVALSAFLFCPAHKIGGKLVTGIFCVLLTLVARDVVAGYMTFGR